MTAASHAGRQIAKVIVPLTAREVPDEEVPRKLAQATPRTYLGGAASVE
jgi:hypothetical protein